MEIENAAAVRAHWCYICLFFKVKKNAKTPARSKNEKEISSFLMFPSSGRIRSGCQSSPSEGALPAATSGVEHRWVNRAVGRASKSLAVALIVSATLKRVPPSPNSCVSPPLRRRDPLFRAQDGVFTWPMPRRANKLI